MIEKKVGKLAIRDPLYQKSDSLGERLHRPIWEKMERHRGGAPGPVSAEAMASIVREHNLHEGLTGKQFKMLVDGLRNAKSAKVVKMTINLFEGWKTESIPP